MCKNLILILAVNALVLASAGVSAKEISYKDYMRQSHAPVPAMFGEDGMMRDTSSIIASFAAYPTISSADLVTLPKYNKKNSAASARNRHLY
jgi:p-aminobenzoyl-glutamate transporter AbgT